VIGRQYFAVLPRRGRKGVQMQQRNGETKRKPGGRGERTEDVRDQGEGYYKEVFWSTLESLYMLENLMMNQLFLLNPVII